MEKKGPLKAALYVRVSTEEQASGGFSLDAQMSKLRSYCKVQGWDIAAEYCEEGESGRSTKRPEYQRMMSEHDIWDVILVYKLDRIHRNSVNFALMIEELDRLGKDFCSIQDQLDTSTAMGRFVRDITERIAQLESEQIGERVAIAMDKKRSMGGVISRLPLGYKNRNGKKEVDNDEKYIVRAIFTMYNNGHSMDNIANYLNAAGFRTKSGGIWYRSSIHHILHNPVYTGVDRRGRICGEAIIDRDMFDRVNGL
ncbi:MAG: recombinase family protein [Candidatus Methanomethylophilaceae archaeon]|nr:recombinase family protein [Candidatus Methanomethylophilaceae archaeon]MDY5872502.1 recombinase family protein [Candidatus Methanomethylophilaceae archaeon]